MKSAIQKNDVLAYLSRAFKKFLKFMINKLIIASLGKKKLIKCYFFKTIKWFY
ncbi:hypothetical protein HanRHA438_Chr06g0252411 [Helianthus annuus]|uniref:Uncharacterized protein n=1 Tax=Helianthus annuus TaxID=4232 RepID=A0A9K3IR48_HELAN|nr:hypothetical protein HanXRQr2_Chr06g0243411 [Helianthus annuus]KAJ0910449.1 hypothetical protein HanRHA438_Chr06g0252411 [Helianthus annuus]